MNYAKSLPPLYQFAFASDETGNHARSKRVDPCITVTNATGDMVCRISYRKLNMTGIAFFEDAIEAILGADKVDALYKKAQPALTITGEHLSRIICARQAALG